jgi:transposase
METSSKTCVAVDTEQATLFVALELSQATWLVGLHSPIADKISINRIDGGDTDKLLALIEKKREQAARQLGRPVRVVSCYEAGRDGFWLHRFLIGHGIDNRVLDSASILVDRRARRAKTDRLDAAALLRVLMALVRGEEQVCRVVQVPSIAQEDERRLSRERERLLHERNSHIARIKGLLALHGVRDYRLVVGVWKERLDAIRTANGHALPARAKTEIERECRVVGQGDARRGGAGDRADDRARQCGGRQADQSAWHRTNVRQRADARGLLPQLRQPPAGRQLPGAGLDPVAEWRRQARPGHHPVGQRASAAMCHRAGVVVVAASARQRARGLVPHPYRHHDGTHAPDRAGGIGTQADRCPLALSADRHRAGGSGDQGVTGLSDAAR